jgi:predicted acylesterase/phospholipase RssA
MHDGTPAVVSNINMEKNVFGKRIDVLKGLDAKQDLSVAAAVALGARFPYFSPAGRIGKEYFVDGGYFDNSGAGVVHEMILDLQSMIMDSININPQHPYKKIRFNVLHITNETETEKKISAIHPLVNDLAAPVKTILGSYARQTDINNLRLYKYLLEIYKGDTTYTSINLYKKGEENDYPMNWSISEQSLIRMNKRLATHEGIASIVQSIKQ